MFVILFFCLTSLSQRDGSTTPLPPPTMTTFTFEEGYALPTEFKVRTTPKGGRWAIEVRVSIDPETQAVSCAFEATEDNYSRATIDAAVEWVRARIMDGTIVLPSLYVFGLEDVEFAHEF